MAIIGLCALLVAVGVAVVVRWGGGGAAELEGGERRLGGTRRSMLARLADYGLRVAAAGLIAGLLAGGAGGRLAMRALALTSPESESMSTEGGAVIGEITLDGTLSVLTFVGLTSGLLTAALLLVLRPILPRGRVGGLAMGAILLVLVGSRVEPLRADNIDFALVGPDWMSVSLFAAVALLQGMVAVSLADRLAGASPTLPFLAGGGKALTGGRIVAGAVVLAALPGFVTAVGDILISG